MISLTMLSRYTTNAESGKLSTTHSRMSEAVAIETLVAAGLLRKAATTPKKDKYAEAARLEAIERARAQYERNKATNQEAARYVRKLPEARAWLAVLDEYGERVDGMADWLMRVQLAIERLKFAALFKDQLCEQLRTAKSAGERRAARMMLATPEWADFDKIQAIYEERDRLTQATGIPHHVDHIEPLAGRLVCGLHVHWNLRAIPATDNIKKGNKVLH